MRYALTLQSFDFEITYKSGKIHADADCLSRYPTFDPGFNSITDENYEQGDDIFTMLITEEQNFDFDLINQQRSDPFIYSLLQLLDKNANLKRKDKIKLISNYRIRQGVL